MLRHDPYARPAPVQDPAEKIIYFTYEYPRKVHTSGETFKVKLHIHPRNDEQVTISNLRIHFKGKAFTGIMNHNTKRPIWDSKICLFAITRKIVPKEATFSARQSWTVEFEFPWHVLPHASQSQLSGQHPLFPSQPIRGHLLPPSCEYNFGAPVRVMYYVEAEYRQPADMVNVSKKEKYRIRFCPHLEQIYPATDPQTSIPQQLAFSSRLLDPKRSDGRYGIRQKAKDMISSTTPCAMFDISATAPSACCLGLQLPIDLHFKYNATDSTTAAAPEVIIKGIKIRVVALADTRHPASALTRREYYEENAEQPLTLVHRPFSTKVVAGEEMQLHDIVPIYMRPQIVPSFRTFNLARTYRLEVWLKLECGMRKHRVTVIRHPIEVFPSLDFCREVPEHIPDLNNPPEGAVRAIPAPNNPADAGRINTDRDSYDTLPIYQSRTNEQRNGTSDNRASVYTAATSAPTYESVSEDGTDEDIGNMEADAPSPEADVDVAVDMAQTLAGTEQTRPVTVDAAH